MSISGTACALANVRCAFCGDRRSVDGSSLCLGLPPLVVLASIEPPLSGRPAPLHLVNTPAPDQETGRIAGAQSIARRKKPRIPSVISTTSAPARTTMQTHVRMCGTDGTSAARIDSLTYVIGFNAVTT
jgi:hypothetical protein